MTYNKGGDKAMNILAIGAHAADMEFSVGPLLAAATQQGHHSTILHLSWGEKGNPTLSAEDYKKQKQKEATVAAEILGCSMTGLSLPDASVSVDEEIAREIVALIASLKPEVVITHWKGSFHSDHRNTHHLVQRALFLASLPGNKQWQVPKLYYTDNWEDQEQYAVDGVFDVSNAMETWIRACRCYTLFTKGGILSFNYERYYTGLFQMRGALSRTAWAVGVKEHISREHTRIFAF